ncbi:MAG TPA: heat-inducible transcriptional repressor HrcA [Dehalococcoidia bacterium]|nr:heat-inducible transcriptional repressor HrcA [Dehalococcoidia bacterium]
MLTPRRDKILNIIVEEYISKGLPVSSEIVARRGLGVSTATVRNEMMGLEEGGYIAQPHTSAGRVPMEKGYRHYIETLMGYARLTQADQLMIRHQFHQVERVVEEWARLAAAILSGMVHNAALVTLPKTVEARLKHLELVSLHELFVLLVLVLKEAKLRQQVLTLEEGISQEELSASARQLTSTYTGLSASQISAKNKKLTPLEERVTKAIVEIMESEEQEEYEEPYVDGLRHMLRQPEFASSEKIAALMEVIEQKSLLKSFLPRVISGEGVQVFIGRENKEKAMRDCSVIVTRYGIPGEVGGAIGVMGPIRMEYDLAIPTVRFLSKVMSELVGDLYG